MNNTTPITAEQCYFGEKDRGHGLLSTSFDNQRLHTFLSRVTDMPINKPADLNPGAFYGCHAHEDVVVFTKTVLDQQASRSGMVFTHAISIAKPSLARLSCLDELFSLFVAEIPQQKTAKLPSLLIPDRASASLLTKERQAAVLPLLHFLLSANETDYCIIPLDDHLPTLYIDLWNALLPTLRHLLTFRLSFHPNDILTTDYQLYVTPIGLLNRWPQQTLYETFRTANKPTSLVDKFLLRGEETAPFMAFLKELNYTVKDFGDLHICELAFTSYRDLVSININKLLQLFRLIIRLSPSKNDGKAIKKAVLTAISEQIDQRPADTFPVLSMANIQWTAFDTSPSVVGNKLVKLIANWWREGKSELVGEVLQRRLSEQNSVWWTTAIDAGFEQQFKAIRIDDARMTWTLWQSVEKAIDYLWHFIGVEKTNEQEFMTSLPELVDRRVSAQIVPFLKEHRWLRLHASLIMQYMRPQEALAEQVALSNTDKPSLSIIANQFAPLLFVQSAIPYKNQLLTEIAQELPISMVELDQSIHVDKSEWQDFIVAKLYQSSRHHKDVTEFDLVLTRVMDGLVNGLTIKSELLAAIAETSFADLSSYKKRAKVWDKLPITIRDQFLKATGRSLLDGLTTVANLEPALKEAMLSLNIAGEYMRSHTGNWSKILRMFELFSSLPEKYLFDHITYSNQIDTGANAVLLGKLISRNKWRSCATVVYQKAKTNESYKLALKECLNLLGFWDKLQVSFLLSNLPATRSVTEVEWLSHLETLCNELYDEETEIRILWQKAGGDVADLRSKESARVIWHHALQQLKKGKVNGLTFEELIQEMIVNAHAKRDQLDMLLNTVNVVQASTKNESNKYPYQ